MTNESQHEDELLAIELDGSKVSVSYVSSLLRLLQATLREVARSNDGTRPYFERRPHPMLLLPGVASGGNLAFRFAFADPRSSRPLDELSSMTFGSFLDRFVEFVRSLPQPGLWGGASRKPGPSRFESDVERRMHQLYRELRRASKVTMRFQGRTVEIEGDRMEIT